MAKAKKAKAQPKPAAAPKVVKVDLATRGYALRKRIAEMVKGGR